ncbi:hypothetical protein DFH07DRAFT_1037420 [Mycena maculata]|uniref:F-box domain-containing protein n=1 Tax=Mycena maculata TaxID=230809 RepID=A0AAD7INK0_9AGAR|nr:hypothetical protein DFH07DRAFT_1037420 [Mycena maculata]
MSISIVLSNRATEYQGQHKIIQRDDGSLTFAPVNRFALTLPPELTSLIFLFCLPDDEFISPEPSSAPLLLCRICRQWRHIALATPGLWASLFLDLDWFFPMAPNFEEPAPDLGLFFRQWLSNARSLPLSLRVEDDPKYDDWKPGPTNAGYRSVFRMIGQLSAQWRKITLRVSPPYFNDAYPSSTVFPWLEQLAVPQVEMSETPWMRNIPWKQLTVFRSEKISVSECVHVLRDAPNLLHCSFSIRRESSRVVASLPPLHLWVLRVLEITDYVGETKTLLQSLTLPALLGLTLKFPLLRHVHYEIGLIPFASRSPQLRELTLCLIPSSQAWLVTCLRSFPSVTTLRLQLPKGADDLICHLKSDINLFPRLESLHIVQNTPYSRAPNVDGLLEMLSARWDPPFDSQNSRNLRAQLRSFESEYSDSTAIDSSMFAVRQDPRFRLLKERGMSLQIGLRNVWFPDWCTERPSS